MFTTLHFPCNETVTSAKIWRRSPRAAGAICRARALIEVLTYASTILTGKAEGIGKEPVEKEMNDSDGNSSAMGTMLMYICSS